MVSFGPLLLRSVTSPSAAIACPPDRQISAANASIMPVVIRLASCIMTTIQAAPGAHTIMDQTTLAAYDRDAAAFAREWETQPAPSDLHDVVRRFFAPGPTADIGCGSGRDTAWLGRNGFA